MLFVTHLTLFGIFFLSYTNCVGKNAKIALKEFLAKRIPPETVGLEIPKVQNLKNSVKATSSKAPKRINDGSIKRNMEIKKNAVHTDQTSAWSITNSKGKLSLNEQGIEPSTKKLKLTKDDTQKGIQMDLQTKAKSPQEYINEQLKSIFNQIKLMIEKFLSSLPKDVPKEISCILRLSLENDLMDELRRSHFRDLIGSFKRIQFFLDNSADQFNFEHLIRVRSNTKVVCFEIIKSNLFLWRHIIKRSSNFSPLSIGWTFFIAKVQKFDAILADYQIFFEYGTDKFQGILLIMRFQYFDLQTNQFDKECITEKINKLQKYFSLFRYYGYILDLLYPDPIEQKTILIMTIYYFQIFDEMKDIFDELLIRYMNRLGLHDLHGIYDSRLTYAVNTYTHFYLFEVEMKKFLMEHPGFISA